jgi:hypothetical protein
MPPPLCLQDLFHERPEYIGLAFATSAGHALAIGTTRGLRKKKSRS